MLNNGINHFWRTVPPLRMRTLNVVKTDSILPESKMFALPWLTGVDYDYSHLRMFFR